MNEFVEQQAQYIKSLGTSVRVGGHKYEYLTIDSINEILKEIHNIEELYTMSINKDDIHF